MSLLIFKRLSSGKVLFAILTTKHNSLINLNYKQFSTFFFIINQLYFQYQSISESTDQMLPYHIIYPEKREQNDSEFLHYFSLGSYQTSFTHPNIFSFSKITLMPKKHLPKLTYDDLKAKCESQGSKFHKLIIPLYGNFTVDQKPISNLLELQVDEKGEQNKDNGTFVAKECNFVQDFEYIANKEEKDKNAVFLYVLYKTTESNQVASKQNLSYTNRFSEQIQQKSFNIFPIISNSTDLEFSFIQVTQTTKIHIKAHDLIYLQKGKLTILEQGDFKSLQIKNKGNRKGEQNYIDNMIFAAEQMKVQFEKGSLVFFASSKSAFE